jgi:choline dehydrogenase-like flavoprotein
MDRPNLTVLTGALVTRVTFDRTRATGVEFSHDGTIHRVGAGSELVLSLGAIHTPKVLMQSGIGDRAELQRHGIPVRQHLPGVGQNLQDHPRFDCVWEYPRPLRDVNLNWPRRDGRIGSRLVVVRMAASSDCDVVCPGNWTAPLSRGDGYPPI